MKSKYVKFALKTKALMIAIPAVLITVLFLIVSLISRNLAGNVWVCFIPVGIGAVWYLGVCFSCIRFVQMIENQEAKYNVTFDDAEVQPINGSGMFLTRSWLIVSGKRAFHRESVKSVSVVPLTHGKTGAAAGYRIALLPERGRAYRFVTPSAAMVKKVQEWHERTRFY